MAAEKGSAGEKMKSYRELIMRCPRLGGEVPFSYCEREAGDLPCRQVATMAEGRIVREGLRITQESVIEYLGGLPDDHKHCALLAANTLHKALKAYIVRGTGL
jgi:hypothetical protein